jgi:hypothetical protein
MVVIICACEEGGLVGRARLRAAADQAANRTRLIRVSGRSSIIDEDSALDSAFGVEKSVDIGHLKGLCDLSVVVHSRGAPGYKLNSSIGLPYNTGGVFCTTD